MEFILDNLFKIGGGVVGACGLYYAIKNRQNLSEKEINHQAELQALKDSHADEKQANLSQRVDRISGDVADIKSEISSVDTRVGVMSANVDSLAKLMEGALTQISQEKK